MVHLILLVFGSAMLAGGFWQYRHPEKTQAFALRCTKFGWQRRIFESENYILLTTINGFTLLVIGCAVVAFVLVDLALGPLL